MCYRLKTENEAGLSILDDGYPAGTENPESRISSTDAGLAASLCLLAA